ncbi:MAG: hypothetical protein NC123_01080 [Butyrivibrio sp.]|nr:hypothetical protein [Acetatifactor muris]MCM1558129.1 hypothetical protein [Butyrivibrio sp.]
MKKNLLSILILVLLLVNIAMTAVMMISVMGTNKKTGELVTSIATVLNLELYNPGGVPLADVPLSETETYTMEEIMIPLKFSVTVNEDGSTQTSTKQNYFIFTPTLYLNTKHEDYKSFGGAEKMAELESQIQVVITDVVRVYTLEECQNDLESIQDEILTEIQKMFDSNLIFKIGISKIKFG